MDPVYQHFLLGCVGAIAPEVVRLYGIAKAGGTWKFSAFYYGTSVTFMLLGGLIAAILPSASLLGAFYAGIGTPLIINSVLKKLDPATAQPDAAPSVKKGGGSTAVPAKALSRYTIFTRAL